MKRTARDRRPNLRPPTRIEVNESNTRRRVILLAICIAIAVAAFAYGINSFVKSKEHRGFTEIKASGSESVGDEIRFYYQLGEKKANKLYSAITELWGEACEDAYRIFSAEETYEGIGNLASLSKTPGEVVTLDPTLYAALEMLDACGVRVQYLAPIELHYRSVFYAESDWEALGYDITKTPELSAYYGELAAFARDPEAIRIELLGDCKASLILSDAYRAYAAEKEITTFVSLGYLKNAFVVDYLASVLAENGYVAGTLTSDDGFTRNLDLASGRSYSLNLFCRNGNAIDLAARFEDRTVGALISLRSYPISAEDLDRYYLFEDGRTMTAYLSLGDGGSRTSSSDLVLYGGDSCAALMIAAIPLWVADTLDGAALVSLSFDAIWCTDGEIRCTDPAAPILDLNSEYEKVNLS